MEVSERVPKTRSVDLAAVRAKLSNVIDNQATQAIHRHFPPHKQLNTISRGGTKKAAMDAFIDAVIEHSRSLKRQVKEAADDKLGDIPLYTGWPDFLDAALTESLEANPELFGDAPADPVGPLEGAEGDEPEEQPLPDPLARLVPNNVADAERIEWLRAQWQRLTHKLMSPQTFGEMSEAERIEHQELERYRGLFT